MPDKSHTKVCRRQYQSHATCLDLEPYEVAVVISEYNVGSGVAAMIRKLASGKYRLYSRKKNPKTGRRRNLGTFASRAAAQKHERALQFFKRG